MSAPRWSRALLRRLAPEGREEEVLGDLEEVHRRRVAARGRVVGGFLTALETLDMAAALATRRGAGMGLSWLDVKLGVRMLVRYPTLTVLGGLAIAFAIFAGSGTFEFLAQVAHPRLPFEDGDRLVGIELWDARAGGEQHRALFDLAVWREELATVEELGAFTSFSRNLVVEGWGARAVRGASMDASGFRVTAVEPLLGRTLVDGDQRPGAPLAVVLGHGLWRNVLGGDPEVLGRVVRVGTEAATVVGVMPEGFAFPVAHDLWLPLRVDPRTVEAGQGPGVRVFGRLAPGATLDDARTELTRVGQRLASALPATHADVRPFVKPYALSMLGLPATVSDGFVSAVAMSWNLPLVLFLVLVCGNVALLVFARAAARERELVVRAALGAGRRRIVGQLFTEALVLAVVGAAVGLSLAGYGLRWGYGVFEREIWEGPLPFWFHPELSLRTVAYVAVLTLVGAAVAGAAPGLRATRTLGTRLREASAGGGGLRIGGVWTVVLVTQIALTVVFPVVALAVWDEGREIETFDPGIPGGRYLTAAVALPGPEGADGTSAEAGAAPTARTTLLELEAKLLADPRVAGVTFADLAPRMYSGWHQVEVDAPTAPPQDERGHRMGSARVETDFFSTLGIEPRSGRDFVPADAEDAAASGDGEGVAIVNEGFVDYVLGGRNAVGVHLRYVASERVGEGGEPGPWHRIVGVVQDLGSMSGYSSAVVYHPVPPGSMNPSHALVHVRGDAMAFAPSLREIAFDVEPTLRVGTPVTLDRVVESTVEFYRFWVLSLGMVSVVAVVLSLGGIYAVMAFTVARRTREIGVRVALGAPRRRIVLSTFRRPLAWMALGVVLGALVGGVLIDLAGAMASPADVAGFAGYLAIMTGVCVAACVAPTRRALAVEPSEALRSE